MILCIMSSINWKFPAIREVISNSSRCFGADFNTLAYQHYLRMMDVNLYFLFQYYFHFYFLMNVVLSLNSYSSLHYTVLLWTSLYLYRILDYIFILYILLPYIKELSISIWGGIISLLRNTTTHLSCTLLASCHCWPYFQSIWYKYHLHISMNIDF